MTPTDLQLILDDLIAKRDFFKELLNTQGGETNAARHLAEVERQIRLLRQLDSSEHEKLVLEDRDKANERRRMMADRQLLKALRKLSDKDHSQEYLEKKISALIRLYLRERQSFTSYSHSQAEEIQNTDPPQSDNKKHDKIYELTEAVYDGLLGSFEVSAITRYPSKPVLRVERVDGIIMVTLSYSGKGSITRAYTSRVFMQLKKLGYELNECQLICTFSISDMHFEDLIQLLSRTLIDFMTAGKSELELRYEEWEA